MLHRAIITHLCSTLCHCHNYSPIMGCLNRRRRRKDIENEKKELAEFRLQQEMTRTMHQMRQMTTKPRSPPQNVGPYQPVCQPVYQPFYHPCVPYGVHKCPYEFKTDFHRASCCRCKR